MDATQTQTQIAGQDTISVEKNSQFFDANGDYAKRVDALETYENIRRAINPAIEGSRHLLDVGNGGVFDYDTSLAEQIVGVDLFLQGAPADVPGNVVLRYGDALSLDEPDTAYDRVLEVAVLHHLVGRDVASTFANVQLAVGEAYRVLEPGGLLVIMESCISSRAFAVERRLFGALRQLARTQLMRHPATLQFSPGMISGVIEERFGNVSVTPIPVGRWILQFGKLWPCVLTPARPYLFTAIRA